MSNRKKYQRHGKIFWEKHVADWRKSGLTQAEYCRLHNLQQSSLSNWNVKLNKPVCKKESFIAAPFNFDEIQKSDRFIEIVISQEIVIKIREDVDSFTLSTVIASLKEAHYA